MRRGVGSGTGLAYVKLHKWGAPRVDPSVSRRFSLRRLSASAANIDGDFSSRRTRKNLVGFSRCDNADASLNYSLGKEEGFPVLCARVRWRPRRAIKSHPWQFVRIHRDGRVSARAPRKGREKSWLEIPETSPDSVEYPVPRWWFNEHAQCAVPTRSAFADHRYSAERSPNLTSHAIDDSRFFFFSSRHASTRLPRVRVSTFRNRPVTPRGVLAACFYSV